MVPLTINYVNPEKYGIWLSVSTIVLWFNFFDIGLGNGLRNQLSIAIANDDIKTVRKLISTAYASLIIISIGLFCIFWMVNHLVNYSSILNISANYQNDIKDLMGIIFGFFCIQFVLQIINSINYAFQQSSAVSFTLLFGSLLSLIFIVVFKYTTSGSLLNLGIAYFSGTLLSLITINVYFFGFKRPDLIPSLKDISFASSKSIMNVGGKFFVISMAGIVQYQTDNVLISRYFHPTSVTEYNVAYKLFSVILMVFGIVMTPVWSAVTEAKVKGDYSWIKALEKNLFKIWMGFAVAAIIILLLSPYIFNIWLHRMVKVHFITSLGVMLYVLSMSYGMIYVHILNGLGRLKTQFYISLVTMVLFIPMTYLIAIKMNLGILGISISLIIANANGLLAAPLEFKKIFKKL
ncbi:polysaccharide biosynthesis protein [Mucilaginibacter terrenus]|uniref:Polysaccharide biosynthesis protein n=2 Tax=Mucilaginibacter terrenus TaxID=2482727 RepID=A0A3E2NXU3_9SPHI|nr:polysaccharide biosynthesis protein [Mucilaginibacter terrenus]